MRQVEVSRTLVFDAPRRARAFFEALIADNLDIGRPANVEIIFGRRIRRDTPGVFRTAIDRPAVGPDTGGVVLNAVLQALADQAVPQLRHEVARSEWVRRSEVRLDAEDVIRVSALRPVPAVTCVPVSWAGGCGAHGKAQGSLIRPGITGEGKAGRG